MTTLFVSDLHLHSDHPEATRVFLDFLAHQAPRATSLYILGDLFESWIGDDCVDEHNQQVINALKNLTDIGTRCYFMHGNRDFLIGQQFANLAGIKILHDPTLIYVGGQSVLITHGDILCTDDIGYQRYRRIIQHPRSINILNRSPKGFRVWLRDTLHKKSRSSTQRKRPEIQDVNSQAVIDILKNYSVTTVLHGHTHRPAIHDFQVGGKPARRIVLGDWYTQGSVLSWETAGPEFLDLDYTA